MTETAPRRERPPLRRSQVIARVSIGTAIVLIVVMWVYAFGGFATRQAAAKLDDRAWTQRAEEICQRRNLLLEKNALNSKDTSDGSPQAVGAAVSTATDLIERALDQMLEPPPASELDRKLVDQFESLYRTYIQDRREVAVRLANGEAAELNETMLQGSPISETIADFTRPNLMESCSAPAQY